MMKQVKLFALMALIVTGQTMHGLVDPVDYICQTAKKSHTLGLYVAAMIMGNLAYTLSEREFDDKGCFRSVGDSDVDPITADMMYCLATGAGITAVENTLFETDDLTTRGSIEKTITNAVCCFLTNLVTAQNTYKSLDRNHVLLRGWLPWSTKFDDSAKKALVFAITRSLIGRAKNLVNTPAVI